MTEPGWTPEDVEAVAATLYEGRFNRPWAHAGGRWHTIYRNEASTVLAVLAERGRLARPGELVDLHTRVFDAESALAELVRLRDGPRDSAYERAKPLAWARARAVLEQLPAGLPVDPEPAEDDVAIAEQMLPAGYEVLPPWDPEPAPKEEK